MRNFASSSHCQTFGECSDSSSLITRLVRLCPADTAFQSYTELTLGCSPPLTARWNVGTATATAAQLASKVCSCDVGSEPGRKLVTCWRVVLSYKARVINPAQLLRLLVRQTHTVR